MLTQRIRINQIILGGFGIIILLKGATTITTQISNKTLIESNRWVAHTFNVEADLRTLERKLVDAETGQRGFVITGEDRYLEPYQAAIAELDTTFADLKTLISDNPEQIKRLSVVEELADDKLAELKETIDLKRQGKQEELLALIKSDQGKDIMDAIRVKLAEMVAVEDELMEDRAKVAANAESLSNWITWGSFGCITIVAIIISIVIIRVIVRFLSTLQTVASVAERVATGDLTTRISVQNNNDEIGKLMNSLHQMTKSLTQLIGGMEHSGIKVHSSATQIASASKQLEAAMSEQVASTNQITATAQEIAVSSNELAQTVDQVTELAQKTTETARQGQVSLQQMETTIQDLAQATTSISARLGNISDKTSYINTVVATITKVADQTNLLSLNAAIEAEKAGEYGTGFAVVAREIRRLADQTAVSTLEIDTMVNEMQSAVSTGVMEMDKFTQEVAHGVEETQRISGQVALVIEQVKSLSPQLGSVNQGMGTQAQGAEQIRSAMEQLNETSRQTISSMRDVNEVIDSLYKIVQDLQQEIGQFKVANR
ncbi:MAG: CHASE3 domain-containing protein [Leptolyngbyaceae cyanobacterium MO_188.B28]|nr:CHASE3 domain-containing protein [Leptolyngbyaceae cyanobacterium MO_188.B28]